MWLGARESWPASVLCSCPHEDCAEAVGASHNAVGRGAWDDWQVRTTVLIVDDHEGFRQSARALLEAEGFAVVGDAADGAAAVAEVARLRPDVVLLDVQLPDLDGFAVAGRLAAAPRPAAGGADLEPRRGRIRAVPGYRAGLRVPCEAGASGLSLAALAG